LVETILQSLPSIALALFICLLLARFSLRSGVPRVSIYLLVGVALGPHGIGLLFGDHGIASVLLLQEEKAGAVVELIQPIAVAFILFRVGGEFQFRLLRQLGPRLLALAGSEILLTGLLVGFAVWIATGEAALGLIAPALAISSAPSATLLTLREVEAEGPSSHSLILLVGVNNLFTLLAFPLLLVLAFGVGSPLSETGLSFLALFGGFVIGFIADLLLETFTAKKDHAILGVLVVLGALGFSHVIASGDRTMGAAMLACFAAGFVVINGSARGGGLFQNLEGMVYPLYVLFFLGSGMHLDLHSLLGLGLLGVLFIGARVIGKILGTLFGIRLAGWKSDLPNFMGTGLLCQAGVALALIAILGQIPVVAESTANLRNVVLGSVVFFEVLGPYLCRLTVVKAGEVTLANLLPMQGAPKGRGAVREVRAELGRNLGVQDVKGLAGRGELNVRHCMRRVPPTVKTNLTFDLVLKTLSESGSDILPVVDGDGVLRGILSFREVQNLLYDPQLRELVIAEDLMLPIRDPLEPETPLSEALAILDSKHVQSWPVTEDGKLAGILKRQDAYSAIRKGWRTEGEGSN